MSHSLRHSKGFAGDLVIHIHPIDGAPISHFNHRYRGKAERRFKNGFNGRQIAFRT